MNTADITCDKMTERTNNNNNQHMDLNTELEILAEVRNKCSGDWYDRVYFCYEDLLYNHPNDSLPIIGFKCYKYNSFTKADTAWNKDLPNYNKFAVRSTLIPMCKWMPEVFDKYILNWKLRNMFWVGKHTLGQGYNRNSKEK